MDSSGIQQQQAHCRIRRGDTGVGQQSPVSGSSTANRNGTSTSVPKFLHQQQPIQQLQQHLRHGKKKSPWLWCLQKGNWHWHMAAIMLVVFATAPVIILWIHQSPADSNDGARASGSSVEDVVKRSVLSESLTSFHKQQDETEKDEGDGKAEDGNGDQNDVYTSGWLNAKHRVANANVGGLMTEEWAESMILDYIHLDDWGLVLNTTVCMGPSKFRDYQQDKALYTSIMGTSPRQHLAKIGRNPQQKNKQRQQRGGGISGFVEQQPFFGRDSVQNLVHQLLYLAFHDHQHAAARKEAQLRRRRRRRAAENDKNNDNDNDKLPFAIHKPKAMTPFEIHHAPRSRAGMKQRHHTIYTGRQRVGVMDYQCQNAKFIVSSLPSVGLGATVRFAAVEALFLGMVTNRIGVFINALENAPIAAMRQTWKLVSCKREDYQCFYLPLTPCVLTRADIARAPVVRLQDIKRIYREGPWILPPEIQNARVIVAQNDVIRTKEPLGIREVLLRRVLRLYDVTMGRLRRQKKKDEKDDAQEDGFYALPMTSSFNEKKPATETSKRADDKKSWFLFSPSDTTEEEGGVEDDDETPANGTSKRKPLPPLPLEEQWPEVVLTELFHDDDDETDRRLKQSIADLIRNANRTSVHTAAYLYITRPNLYYQTRLNRTLLQILPRDYNAETAVGLPIRSSDKCLFEAECLRFEQYLNLLPHFVTKAAKIQQVWGDDTGEASLYDTVVFTTESHAMMEAALRRQNTKRTKRVPFRWILNDQDVVQGTGAPRDFKTLAHMNVSAEDILFSTMVAMKMQLSTSSAVMNCCSNFHALLKQYHDFGCGVSSYPYVECLQENDNPRFRVCCRMTKQYNCNMRIQRGNFGKTFAQPGLDVLHPDVRKYASNSTKKKIAKALAGAKN